MASSINFNYVDSGFFSRVKALEKKLSLFEKLIDDKDLYDKIMNGDSSQEIETNPNKEIGIMQDQRIIINDSLIPSGKYTLRYIGLNNEPLENYREIATFEKA